MPIPILLGAALAFGVSALGAAEHKSAQDTNEKAQRISRDAQDIYNEAKESLEKAKDNTEKKLLKLGNDKKKTLDNSVQKFVHAYDKIKDVQLGASVGLNELSEFTIEQADVIRLSNVSDIYASSVSSGAAGVATGAVIALAVNGTLPIVASELSLAGSVLALGQVGAAAEIAGGALSLGASMTPLAAIVAPAVLFTGVSASIKADENLSKANSIYAQAQKAVEEMETSEVLCEAISERAVMFDKLLGKLDKIFSECTQMLDELVMEKSKICGNRNITANDLSADELELVAVSRALAGAVKAVIDTPILSKEGEVAPESLKVYQKMDGSLPDFSKSVKNVKKAKETNNNARKILTEAWENYTYEREIYEKAENRVRVILWNLGNLKREVLFGAVSYFVQAYDKIAGFAFTEETEGNALQRFWIKQEDVVRLREELNTFSALQGRKRNIDGRMTVALGIGATGLNWASDPNVARFAEPRVLPVDFEVLPASLGNAANRMSAAENLKYAKNKQKLVAQAIENMKQAEEEYAIVYARADKNGQLLHDLRPIAFEYAAVISTLAGSMHKKKTPELADSECKLIRETFSLMGAVNALMSAPIVIMGEEASASMDEMNTQIESKMPEYVAYYDSVKGEKRFLAARKHNILQTTVQAVHPVQSMEMMQPIKLKESERKLSDDDSLKLEKKIKAMAIWSFILGILSLCTCGLGLMFSVPGIILACRSGELRGGCMSKMAVAGLVCNVLSVSLLLVMLFL